MIQSKNCRQLQTLTFCIVRSPYGAVHNGRGTPSKDEFILIEPHLSLHHDVSINREEIMLSMHRHQDYEVALLPLFILSKKEESYWNRRWNRL